MESSMRITLDGTSGITIHSYNGTDIASVEA